NESGFYTLNNMRVGGPYTVEISYLGYRTETITDISLKLGETYSISSVLVEEGIQLEGVEVVGTRSDFLSSKRTGASTNVSQQKLGSLPQINRSVLEFTRLTPQAN